MMDLRSTIIEAHEAIFQLSYGKHPIDHQKFLYQQLGFYLIGIATELKTKRKIHPFEIRELQDLATAIQAGLLSYFNNSINSRES